MKKEEGDKKQVSTEPAKQEQSSRTDKDERTKEREPEKSKDKKHDNYTEILESGLGIDE